MATLLDVMTNRPGGLLEFEPFDWFEGETLNLRVRLLDYPGGPAIDCTGWTVEAKLYQHARTGAAGDLPIAVIAGLSGDGWLSILGTSPLNLDAAGPAPANPSGKPVWLSVMANMTDTSFGTFNTPIVKPSRVTLRQWAGATS